MSDDSVIDFPKLMAECDELDRLLNDALAEEAAAIRKRELAEARSITAHRALMLVGGETEPKTKPVVKRKYTKKGATVPSASELPAQHRHSVQVEPVNSGAGASNSEDPFPIIQRAK